MNSVDARRAALESLKVIARCQRRVREGKAPPAIKAAPTMPRVTAYGITLDVTVDAMRLLHDLLALPEKERAVFARVLAQRAKLYRA